MINEGDPGVYTSYEEAVAADPNHQLLNIAREIMKSRKVDWPTAFNLALDENPELKAKTGWSKFLHVPEADGSVSLIPPRLLDTDDVAAKARALACDAETRKIQAAHSEMTYDAAWQIARAENPELFHNEIEQAPAAYKVAGSETADLASRARALGCSQVVEAIRADNPHLTFEESWDIARAEHKQLFEEDAAGDFQSRCDALDRKLKAISERNNSGSVKVVGIREEI
jgi:hypothetical protein